MRRPSGRHAPLTQTLTFYVPDASYPPSGALDRQSGAIVQNDELDAKLALVNVVSYIGLAAQGKQSKTYESAGGTLYFQSPEVELLPPEMDPFCAPYNPICWCSRSFVQRSYFSVDKFTYIFSSRTEYLEYMCSNRFNGQPKDAKMGIFEAFARQSHVAGNPLGPLRRIFSVVGVSSFEDTFADARYIANFALSARALIVHYNLSGIDLDYENSDMTHAQSWQFLALVRALREQLPRGTFFSSRVPPVE